MAPRKASRTPTKPYGIAREDIPDDDAEAVLVIERYQEEHQAAQPGLGNYTFS